MIRRPPRSTRTDTLFPYTTLFRSVLIRLAVRLALLRAQALRGFQIGAAERVELVARQHLVDLLRLLGGEVGVLVQLHFQLLHLLEALDEAGAGGVALEVGDVVGLAAGPPARHSDV